MADPLLDILQRHLPSASSPSAETSKYLSRLVSLRLGDLTTTEPQSLAQSSQSNLVSIQALSSRSHRTTTTSSDHLSTLRSSLPLLSTSVEAIKGAIPDLDASAVSFASSYNRSKDENTGGNALLNARRESALLARQADKAQDILELPSLLSAAIASANHTGNSSTPSVSGVNYTQALDLFAHIKRLQILYPDSQLVRSILADAEIAMRDMTTNLIASLRSPNIRLAAAIRMIGWLRRVAPDLGPPTPSTLPSPFGLSTTKNPPSPGEGHFGALFLCARLCTFLTMTEALSPLRDLADQETQARQSQAHETDSKQSSTRKPSSSATGYNPLQGQQTERYLKRYIEIFREQSFATISMYRNIFPDDDSDALAHLPGTQLLDPPPAKSPSPLSLNLSLPPALQTFPLHLVDLFMSTLKEYLPNVTDPAARESLLMQVLYAANSLGRLGADFSLMIALLDQDEWDAEGDAAVDANVDTDRTQAEKVDGGETNGKPTAEEEAEGGEQKQQVPEPEWVAVIKKHRIQAARLEALAAGQDRLVQRRESSDIAVR
ncbi:uncharacterized protein Z518_06665 [Rhinocladiella mackenziei CBS 650.93]|uniref:Conserved oligomeric Golgi complex subunit 8 n=1 Tax=Rhinocladiella mackenziei CBS 650.93 TaxID=1442369 RepID=A0A0D2J2H5_9EURO|nr:uncharacterized protein Z518_06665 [Rhinocladiella mackenziei CBS 650.93]KIX03115.1 hypothetical protein Z518_06665 [Rhinocladiella mackenziei CBS 650.93]